MQEFLFINCIKIRIFTLNHKKLCMWFCIQFRFHITWSISDSMLLIIFWCVKYKLTTIASFFIKNLDSQNQKLSKLIFLFRWGWNIFQLISFFHSMVWEFSATSSCNGNILIHLRKYIIKKYSQNYKTKKLGLARSQLFFSLQLNKTHKVLNFLFIIQVWN